MLPNIKYVFELT